MKKTIGLRGWKKNRRPALRGAGGVRLLALLAFGCVMAGGGFWLGRQNRERLPEISAPTAPTAPAEETATTDPLPLRPAKPRPAFVDTTPLDPAIGEELLKTFPDLASRTFDDMAKVLREGALEEFKSAALEMQGKVQRAQQSLAEAREKKSGDEQQAALKAFQQVEAEQANKLKEIAARLQDRIVTLQRLKGEAR